MIFSFILKQSLLEYLLDFLDPCPHKTSVFYLANLVWVLKELLFTLEWLIQIIKERGHQIMISSQILWQFKKGDKIAQLLLLPYISINSSNNVWTNGLYNIDKKQSLWTSLVSEYAWPNVNIKINDKRFPGLLNTESDITIISKHLWPKSWSIQKVSYQIAGISQTKVREIYQNVHIYSYEGPKGQPATLRPYMINAPLNLIEKDLLMQWQTQIYIPHFPRGHCSFNQQYNY